MANGDQGTKPMKRKYAVVLECTPSNYSVYVPDLPGCVSTGESLEDVRRTIREAINFHIEDMLELGEPLPETKMTLEDAEAHHSDVLAEYDDRMPEPPTKFAMVEVEVETPLSAPTG